MSPTGVYDRSKSKPNMGEFGKKPAWNKGKTGIYSKEQLKKLSSDCKKLNPAWKGGRNKNDQGYILVLKTDHPFCDSRGYVREHRLVVEKQIGRYLKRTEQVHHLGQRDDNRPHMLMAFKTDGAHKRFEHGLEIAAHLLKESEIIYDGRKAR